jgi:hypothetical protein
VSKILRAAQTATGLVAFAIASLALASRYLSITHDVVLVTAAFSPYLMLGGPVSVILLALARRWILAIAAVGFTVASLSIQLPLYRGSDAVPTSGHLGEPPRGAGRSRLSREIGS